MKDHPHRLSSLAGILLGLLCVLSLASAARAEADWYVWWEGEDADQTNMTTNVAFRPRNDREANVLSGGAWLGSPGAMANEKYFAEYVINVPRDGEYAFYVRKFWKHGPFRWRFDDGPWTSVPREIALLDTASLRTHTSVSWVKAGQAKLSAGEHRLRVELRPDRSKAACFDAFLLTTRPFQARGRMKPDDKYGKAPQGWWPFEPDWDPYTASPIDLRKLNEPTAGSRGFIAVDGDNFVYPDNGEEVRFWAVNTGHALAMMDKASIDSAARFLAKRGVNMVRIHGGMYHGRGPKASQVDPEKLDRVFYLVAALKKQGIYSAMSIHFQHWLNLAEDEQVPGFDKKTHRPYAIHFYDPAYQKVFKSWWQATLATPNPYTGMTLAEDPAVGYCEIINEDNFFFWTFKPYDVVPEYYMPRLEKLFGQWLTDKYGSIDKAFAAWGTQPGKVKGDHPEQGRVGVYFSGMLTSNDWAVTQRNQRRAEDCARFLTELETRFFADMRSYIKDDLGYAGPVCGSNMGTADHAVLGPLERYSNVAAVDFLDLHGYYGGAKKQRGQPHFAMEVMDMYSDRSALRFDPKSPGGGGEVPALPFLTANWGLKPMVCSEWAWVQPNQYQAEMTILGAVLGRTTGLDGQISFAMVTSPQWAARANSYYPIQVPWVAGQFPAAALMYRTGLLTEGKTVVNAQLGLDKLFALEGSPIIPPKAGQDLNEDMVYGGQQGAVSADRIDPRAYCVGKVDVTFAEGADEHRIHIEDLSKYIDPEARTMTATTGEWTWDYGKGLFALRAPGAQGTCGFLSEAGPVDLGGVKIDSSMTYGAIMAVAMDGKALSDSRKILLQVMSQVQDYGYTAKPETGMRIITDRGTAPMIVKDFAGTVSLDRPDASALKVTRLDINGYPVETTTGAATIELAPTTMYYVIEAN